MNPTSSLIKSSYVQHHLGLSEREHACLLAYIGEDSKVLNDPANIRAIRSLIVKRLLTEEGALSIKGRAIARSFLLWENHINVPIPAL